MKTRLIRGVTPAEYQRLRRLVELGETTWERLVRQRKCTKAKVGRPRKPVNRKGSEDARQLRYSSRNRPRAD